MTEIHNKSMLETQTLHVETHIQDKSIQCKYYIADLLVGTIHMIDKERSFFVSGLSTINFRINGDPSYHDRMELHEFQEYKEIYEYNRKQAEKQGISTHGIGEIILQEAIFQAQKRGKNRMEGTMIATSYTFYKKTCEKLLTQGLIKDFSISHNYSLEIRL